MLSVTRRYVPVVLLTIALACGGGDSTAVPTQPTPPPAALTLSCSTPIEQQTPDNAPVLVTYDEPVAEGGTPPITVDCAPGSDTSFPVGTTTVACTATDSVDVTSSCSFDVTILAPVVTVSSITPTGGPVIGNTSVTVTGENFASGMSLSIGDAPALNVTVLDFTTIEGTTSPSASGLVDVSVTSEDGTTTATLPDGYTYQTIENTPPAITDITVAGSLPGAPPGFIDASEEVAVTVSVSDAEMAISDLQFEWSSNPPGATFSGVVGVFSGSGPAVTWQPPRNVSTMPITYILTVTVIEEYQDTDEAGELTTREHRVTGSVAVRIYDSVFEISELVTEFLGDFANSALSAETVVRHFTDECLGKERELNDVRQNRMNFVINSHTVGTPNVTIGFNQVCPHRTLSLRADACILVSCSFTSTRIATGAQEVASGTCVLTSFFEDDRWKMCDSHFDPAVPSLIPFMD